MGITLQKRQIAILSAVAMLSIIMITGITASTLFDQKADALKHKKFSGKVSAKGGSGVGGKGGSSGSSGSGSIVSGSSNGGSSGSSGSSGTSGG